MAPLLSRGAGGALRLCSARAGRRVSLGVPETAPVRTTLPPPKVVYRWNKKMSRFGVYDNLEILGNFKGPLRLRGWKGNELQPGIRKKGMVGDRMFLQDLHSLDKRIKYLYKQFNRKGKPH